GRDPLRLWRRSLLSAGQRRAAAAPLHHLPGRGGAGARPALGPGRARPRGTLRALLDLDERPRPRPRPPRAVRALHRRREGPGVTLRWALLLSLAMLVLSADQLGKGWAVLHLTSAGQAGTGALVQRHLEPARAGPRELVPGYLQLRYVENPGAAWGTL